MKRIFIIILSMLLSSTALFSQTRIDGTIEYRVDAQNIPYKVKPVSSPARNGEIWRPLMSDFYLELISPTIPYTQAKYSYDKNGVLHKKTCNDPRETWDYFVGIYNETFTKEGFDFEDTLTYYEKKGNTVIPSHRYYGDYHFYDRFPEDSLYYVVYYETWNDATKEWEPLYKQYYGYFDTTLFIIREIHSAELIDGEWIKNSGTRLLREYNEESVVISQIVQKCNPQTGEYETTDKSEYFYDENNIHNETYFYYYVDGSWKLAIKVTDIQYVEWYPNGQPGIGIIVYGEPEYVGIADKRVKIKTETEWILNDRDEWEKYSLRNYYWDIGGTKSHLDTVFLYLNDVGYLYYIGRDLYDERGNATQNWTEYYSAPDEYGNSSLYSGKKYCFHTSYHSQYDYPETESEWEWKYNLTTQEWDSTFLQRLAYYDWIDVSKPISITEPAPSASVALSIFPNPVSGVVTISATSAMQQLSIYDITGRLVASPSPAGERVVFDTGTLPQGVYLVRALLRDGGVRTGKVVVR